MKYLILTIFLSILVFGQLDGQKLNDKNSAYLDNGIKKGAENYLEYHDGKYKVYVIKIVSLKKKSGTFSISSVYSMREVRATHYMFIKGKLFLIITDELFDIFAKKSSLKSMDKHAIRASRNIFRGLNPNDTITDLTNVRKVGILGESSSVTVYTYKKDKMSQVHYKASWQADDIYQYYYKKEEVGLDK